MFYTFKWLFTSFTVLYHVTLTRIFLFSIQKMGGKEHILLYHGINDYLPIFSHIYIHWYLVYHYRTYVLYLFRVLCICILSCTVYRRIFWWEAVKVSGNSIFTFIRIQIYIYLYWYTTENQKWFSLNVFPSFGSGI